LGNRWGIQTKFFIIPVIASILIFGAIGLGLSSDAFAKGQGQPKVTICHVDQDTGEKKTITVSNKAVDKHKQKHGDEEGECAASTDCSPEYWKNNTDVWPVPYTPGDSFNFVFFDQGPNVTLLEALNLNGGGENALARQAVAALLDAARDMDFEPSEIQIRTSVSEAFESGNTEIINNIKNDLENAIIACETED